MVHRFQVSESDRLDVAVSPDGAITIRLVLPCSWPLFGISCKLLRRDFYVYKIDCSEYFSRSNRYSYYRRDDCFPESIESTVPFPMTVEIPRRSRLSRLPLSLRLIQLVQLTRLLLSTSTTWFTWSFELSLICEYLPYIDCSYQVGCLGHVSREKRLNRVSWVVRISDVRYSHCFNHLYGPEWVDWDHFLLLFEWTHILDRFGQVVTLNRLTSLIEITASASRPG